MPKLRDALLDCEKRALALLEHNKIADPTIIRIDSLSILFVQENEPWTAWVNETRDEILRLDRGFVADF